MEEESKGKGWRKGRRTIIRYYRKDNREKRGEGNGKVEEGWHRKGEERGNGRREEGKVVEGRKRKISEREEGKR